MAGCPVGASMDTNYCYGRIPALNHWKYAEAHDLIIRAWTERDPFAVTGRFSCTPPPNAPRWQPCPKPYDPAPIPTPSKRLRPLIVVLGNDMLRITV